MTEQRDEAPSRRRGCLRFSLRTFFIVTTVLCLWFGIVYNRVKRQQDASAAIEAASGSITYNWQIRPPNSDPKAPLSPPGPEWLREQLGPHWFDKIVRVNLDDNEGSPSNRFAILGPQLVELSDLRSLSLYGDERSQADYQLLGRLTKLEKLWINQKLPYTADQIKALPKNLREIHLDGLISPDALRALTSLPKLTTLEMVCRINGSTVIDWEKVRWPRDEHAEAIATVSQLKSLAMYHTHFTNDGLAKLCELDHLENLKIGSREITGEALNHVAKLKKLRHFGALHWPLYDDDLGRLSKLPDLDGLEITGGEITDQGVTHIVAFRNLTWLRLRGSITDQSLQQLQGLRKLKHLDLQSTSVAKYGAAAKQLKTALPDCEILLPRSQGEIDAQNRFLDSKFGVGN